VSDQCTVIIGPAAVLAGLKERAGALDGELLTFTDADALAAFRAIVERRPQVVTLERMFAVTPRGAALINRIKADPTLREAEIRVMAHDGDYTRVVPRTAPLSVPGLDQRGTRRAPRYTMAENTVVVVEGKSGKLIDLSTVGAQTLSPAGLKPNQRIAVALVDGTSDTRFTACVAWTSFEISSAGAPRIRAGMTFEDADPLAVEAFLLRHKA
jgi:hypothetical protein